jgi:flagellar motor protein MotB
MSKRAHASGDFLVSASDLMASLVFVFVIVAVLFAFRARLAEDEARKAKALAEAAKLRADVETAQLRDANEAVVGAAAARKELLDGLAAALERRQIKVEVTDDGIRFQADVLFAVGASRLKPAGEVALRELSKELASLLPCFVSPETNRSDVTCTTRHKYPRGIDAVLVEGHTDAQRFTTHDGDENRDANWDLSAKRALAAFTVLEPVLGGFRNLRAERVLGVTGYGASRPTDANNPVDDRPRDRRIEIRILMAAPKAEEARSGPP